MKKYFLKATLLLMGLMGTLAIGVVNAQEINKDIKLEVTATEANQKIIINKYFANDYTVDRGDGTTGNLTADTAHRYSAASGYTITLSLTGTDRWTFQNKDKPLVPEYGTTVTDVKIVSMPSLADGFGNSETNPGNYFFYFFNENGQLTSLPSGSFDTSKITTVGDHSFDHFNYYGQLTSLPEGSFDTSNITTVGNYFFHNFNYNGAITSLPEGSFDTSNITTVGDYFFSWFNRALTSLPEKSFDISNITKVGDYFFYSFNYQGALTRLPENSFDTSNITTVGDNFFDHFSYQGKLTSLPEGSFRLSTGLTEVGDNFFKNFNDQGSITSLPGGSFNTENITKVGDYFFYSPFSRQLTSLPEGSFDTSNITTVGDYFFYEFSFTKVTSLPEGSFKTENITSVGDYFFSHFNYQGKLTSLPEGSFRLSTGLTEVGDYFFDRFNSIGSLESLPSGSFDTSKITTAGNNFFSFFNFNGQLTSLPEGSFDMSNITTAGNSFFFAYFNCSGVITELPDSFKLSSVAYNKTDGYSNAFNSPNYTINRKVSDLVSGVTVPSNDRNTFSDNQPGRCGVAANWLVTKANACNIVYDANGGIGTITGGYAADTTGVVAGLGITVPTKEGYALSGWYNASGEIVEEVIFPDMDGNILYARFGCDVGYVENDDKTACEKIRVEFDANGGKFSSNTQFYNVFADILQIETPTQITSHTKNLTDEGNYSTNSSPSGCTKANDGSNVEIYESSTGYIHVEGADELSVSIRYGGGSYGSQIGALGVRAGQDTSGQPSWYTSLFPVYGTISTAEFTIQGDSIFIFQDSGYPNYGWFVTVSATGIVEDGAGYLDDAFDNIPQPSREGHKFIGWNLADGTEFKTGSVSTGEITKVYAKWECADGYENKGGECVKKSSGSSGGGGGGGGGGGSSSSSSTGSNTTTGSDNSNNTGNQQTGSGANSSTGTQNEQPTTGTKINEPEANTGSNIQTGNQVDTLEQAPQNDNSNTQDSSPSSQNDGKTYTPEFQQAYEFAKGHGITTMPTIQKADMNGKLTRIAMAKMLSQYAMNVLGQKPSEVEVPKFNDVTDKQNSDYDDGVTLAYQLGIMGQNMPNNRFRPDDEVTRAEFATALSRMIYGTSDGEYKGTAKYYIHHMEKLVREGIITNDDPNMKELRGYVMIMLMRSSK